MKGLCRCVIYKKNIKEIKKSGLKQETKYGIYSIASFVLAIFFILSAFNVAGVAGRYAYSFFSYLFGFGYFLLPLAFIFLGLSFLKPEKSNIGLIHSISSVMFFLSGLGILEIIKNGSGGVFGTIVAYPFLKLFDIYAGSIILFAILVISLFMLFDKSINPVPYVKAAGGWLRNLFQKHAADVQADEDEFEAEPVEENEV